MCSFCGKDQDDTRLVPCPCILSCDERGRALTSTGRTLSSLGQQRAPLAHSEAASAGSQRGSILVDL